MADDSDKKEKESFLSQNWEKIIFFRKKLQKTLDIESALWYNCKLHYNRLISGWIGQNAKKFFTAQGKFRRFDIAEIVKKHGIFF